jgi:pheromone shutdown protein TraB
MTSSRVGSAAARARPGLWAGATVGLLTSFCYIFFFGGLDFSHGNPLREFLHLPLRIVLLSVAMISVGAVLGAIVSLYTPDE